MTHSTTHFKKHILPLIFSLLTVLFAILTIFSFLYGYLTTRNDLGENVSIVSFTNDVPVVVKTDNVLLIGTDQDKKSIQLDDEVASVVSFDDYLAVSYTTDRKIDLFNSSLERINTFEVAYPVLKISISTDGLFVAVKKGQIDGSTIYLFSDLSEPNSYSTIRFTNFIVDMALNPIDGIVYAVAKDYVVYALSADEGLTKTEYARLPYEPIAIGFSDSRLIAADANGNIYFFDNKELINILSLGMTICAFGYNSKTTYAVAANVSGTAFFVDCSTMKIKTKIKAITETATITISDGGIVYLTEHRDFSSKKYSIESVAFVKVFQSVRWVVLALTIILLAASLFSFIYPRLKQESQETFSSSVVKLKKKFVKSLKSYAFILPTLVLLVIFMYIPTIWSLFLSFFDYVPGVYTRFVGFSNFKAALSDPFFIGSIGNMFVFLITDILKALIPSILIAEFIFALNSKKMQYWVRVLLYIPSILPGVAVLLIWTKGIYGDSGLLNSITSLFGKGKIDWLGNPKTSMFSLIAIGFPWVGQYILFYGSLMSIPPSLKEAATLEGCNWRQSIIYIDIPMILSQIKYVFVITFINSIQDFGRIYLTTGQTEQTNIPALQMYTVLNSGNGYGRAAAMGVLLFIFSFAATYINFKSQKQGDEL